MKLVIIGGAGVTIDFYKNVTKELKNIFSSIDVILPIGNSFKEITDFINLRLQNVNENFIILAHCFGGLVALSIVTTYPKLINLKGMILVNTYSDFTILRTIEHIKECNESFDTYKENSIKSVREKGTLDKDILHMQLEILLKINLTHKLYKIDMPVLIIGSNKDGFFTSKNFETLKENINNSTLYIINKARHLALLTHIKKVKRLINTWYKKYYV